MTDKKLPSAELIIETIARILERKHEVKITYQIKQNMTEMSLN